MMLWKAAVQTCKLTVRRSVECNQPERPVLTPVPSATMAKPASGANGAAFAEVVNRLQSQSTRADSDFKMTKEVRTACALARRMR